MSRHRNVRSLNYEDEYYDDDDVYGHSVEDNYCISPGTAAQFTFNRDRNVDLSNFMGHEEGIPEEEEEDFAEDDGDTPRSGHRSSLDYTRPQLNDVDQAKLNSCLEEVRNVVGETVPENIMVDTIIKCNFSLESSLNELLSQQDKPKPQREPRKNRRNRAQGTPTAVAVADSTLPERPAEIKGPTVILKTPTPKKTIEVSSQALSQVSIGDQTQNQSKTGPRTTSVNQSDSSTDRLSVIDKKESVEIVDNKTKNKTDDVDSSKFKDSQKPNGASEDGASSEKSDNLSTPKKERFIPPLPRSASKSKTDKFDLKAEYEKRKGGKDMINMVVIGHVDAGKSTLMGHLLYQLGNVNQRAMHKYEQESKKLGKSSFAYAWVLDETEEERTRGVTMDIAQTKFETPHKIITLLDAPGHKDFIPNMITGTAQADVGILVVNATKGEFETGFESGGQTREHALLARSLGVSQLIVAVNKMDTTGWNPDRYDEIVRKLGQFLKQAGYKEADTAFIPVSGLAGVNLVKPVQVAELQAWYKGSTLVEQIDKFKPVVRPVDKPLRFMISDVFKGMSGGLTLAGKVGSGGIQMGDRVIVMPDAEYGVIKGIGINDSAVNFAFAGDHANVVLTGVDITNVNVGSVLCDMTNPITCATRIQAKIVLFNLEIPMTRGFTVVFHYQSVSEPAIVKKLVSTINKSTGEVIKNKPKCLTKNSSAVVELEFERPVCLELYKDNKELGRFMLRYSGHTIAAGLVEEVLKTKVSERDGSESQGAAAF